MRYNEDLIGRSPLLQKIILTAEDRFSDSLSHIVCYGSFVRGNSHEMSDIDFFFVPRGESGNAFSRQFIWNGIGYDLWPISPDRARRIALLEEGKQSLFMDGKLLYTPDERGLADFEEIRASILKNLGNGELVKTRIGESLRRIREQYFNLSTGRPSWAGVIEIWEGLLFSLALNRRTYVKRGIKGIADECSRLEPLPDNFLNLYEKVLREKIFSRILSLTGEAIAATVRCLTPEEEEKPEPKWLIGFYEEFKSAYNGFLINCDKEDLAGSLYYASQIEGETENFLDLYNGAEFPLLHEAVKGEDFIQARELCRNHESMLRLLLDRNGITVKEYSGLLPDIF